MSNQCHQTLFHLHPCNVPFTWHFCKIAFFVVSLVHPMTLPVNVNCHCFSHHITSSEIQLRSQHLSSFILQLKSAILLSFPWICSTPNTEPNYVVFGLFSLEYISKKHQHVVCTSWNGHHQLICIQYIQVLQTSSWSEGSLTQRIKGTRDKIPCLTLLSTSQDNITCTLKCIIFLLLLCVIV